ncbi:MAG: Lrp/AsnC ligand binding domain-containing protein [Candidatus Bathyarchaeales archaeon]
MVKLESGKERTVFDKVKMLSGVKRAAATFGAYDMILEVSFDNIEDLDEFIFVKLRRISGITDTMSIIMSKVIV